MKKVTKKNEKDAWSDYWIMAETASRDCLPELPVSVNLLLEEIWKGFFATLPGRARLLDLGTGNGAVLVQARKCRSDLRLTGVDYAAKLPYVGENITLLSNVKIEALPFSDNIFSAVTSQFALEYASLPEAVTEMNRVLDQTEQYLLLCHHAEGVIVRDNVERMKAIKDLLAMHGLVEGAIKLARRRKNFDQKERDKLSQHLKATQLRHPGQSVVNEVASSIATIFKKGRGLPSLLNLRNKLEMEKMRIKSLEKAALAETEVNELASMLGNGVNLPSIELLTVPETDLSFAWKVASQPL